MMPPENRPTGVVDAMFDGRDPTGGVDTTLDGRLPINPAPNDPPLPGVDLERFNAAVNSAVDTRIAAVRSTHDDEITRIRETSQRDQTLACLSTLIAGNTGDDVDAMRFRGAVQDLVLQLHAGTDKPHAEILAEANRLHQARMQGIQESGGDGTNLPQVRPESRETDGRFDMGVFMGSLGSEIIRLGDNFDGSAMTGAPELEFASEMLTKLPWVARCVQCLAGRHRAALASDPVPDDGATPRHRVRRELRIGCGEPAPADVSPRRVGAVLPGHQRAPGPRRPDADDLERHHAPEAVDVALGRVAHGDSGSH